MFTGNEFKTAGATIIASAAATKILFFFISMIPLSENIYSILNFKIDIKIII